MVATTAITTMPALEYVVIYSHASPVLVLAIVTLSCITDCTSVSHQCHLLCSS